MSNQFSKFSAPSTPSTPASGAVVAGDGISTPPTEPTTVDPAPVVAPAPVIPVVKSKANLPNLGNLMGNKLFLLGIFGGLMLFLALFLTFASSRKSQNTTVESTPTPSGPEITGTDTLTTSWSTYQDPYNAYLIKYPAGWIPDSATTAIENTKTFSLPDNVKLEINVSKTKASGVENYLQDLDKSRSTAWEGRPSRVVNRTSVIRVGNYDGFERTELISAAGIEYTLAYIMVDDDVFSFALIPGGSDTSIVNQETLRQFHLALSTFEITNQSERLGEWKTYQSTKVEGIGLPTYSISFPATWGINTKKSEASETLTIARNGYKISIAQASIGSAVCLFKDSPAFQGSSGDLRTKDYTEFTTGSGYVLRRYFKGNEGDNSVFLFCGKAGSDTYFVTPLTLGGLTYTVPAKYDADVLKEMDSIVKTLQAQ